ncbi:Smr domain protein [Diplogelasinospora grovesii]|uniref:Smr domain protein n=1 Tax=Diplogelasinospora grovesii TaxID=303347 RepID=A0AAN6NF07_9PEZI|nr:Smr domain protein [Diplogelasinospora grovesii]
MASSAIPMSRLGGRAFNHSASNDAEAEYDRLRDLARSEAGKMKSCFDRAHQAYERGDKAEAKELSKEGKAHQQKKDAYNKQASEFIFRENNAQGRVADDTIDLHGQFVEEAEDILEMRIRDAQARGQTHLHVIVGKGSHSVGHVQKIKPRVEQVCREMGLDYATEENEGRMYIDLSGGRVNVPPPLPPQPGGYQGGYSSGGGYPGNQQHHGYKPPQQQQNGGGYHQGHQQQNQQNQQQDEIEQLVQKALPRILRKLEKACCVVM